MSSVQLADSFSHLRASSTFQALPSRIGRLHLRHARARRDPHSQDSRFALDHRRLPPLSSIARPSSTFAQPHSTRTTTRHRPASPGLCRAAIAERFTFFRLLLLAHHPRRRALNLPWHPSLTPDTRVSPRLVRQHSRVPCPSDNSLGLAVEDVRPRGQVAQVGQQGGEPFGYSHGVLGRFSPSLS